MRLEHDRIDVDRYIDLNQPGKYNDKSCVSLMLETKNDREIEYHSRDIDPLVVLKYSLDD